jgi:hypothetical protein
MLVIISAHSLYTSQAHVIVMKWYCDDMMGGAYCTTRSTTPLPYTTDIHPGKASYSQVTWVVRLYVSSPLHMF